MSQSQCGNTSQDMFEETFASQSSSGGSSWKGILLSELKFENKHNIIYPKVQPTSTHSVLFKLPVQKNDIPKPYPEKTIDFWDDYHVRMPHSHKSLYPVSENELKPRWTIVKDALGKSIDSSEELETAIFTYNSRNNQKSTFIALHKFFKQTLDEGEAEYFFEQILPGIVDIALQLPNKIRGGIPLLRKHCCKSVSLTQDQVSCLIANAFLCTFPRRNSTTHYNPYPKINFNGLFQRGDVKSVPEKLKCFINYFRRVMAKTPDGVITYSRNYIEPKNLPKWDECKHQLPKLYINTKGTIEDEGNGMMEVDFANKFVGGGVLGRGCVQEEIKFLMCPELIVARLLTECLDSSEALIVSGCERFNQYVGYGDTFTWAGDFVDNGERDYYKRKFSTVVAIDATHYSNIEQQYSVTSMLRELNKAYVGFSFGSNEKWKINIATGNWGCGAFNGEPRLKALLQLMAAAVAGRNVAYFTFHDADLRDNIYDIYSHLIKNKVTVGALWKELMKYQEAYKKDSIPLYDFIFNSLNKEESSISKENTTEKSLKKSPFKEMELTEEEMAEAIRCAEEMEECNTPTISKEPKPAESYSIKTEEGKKRGIEIEKQRWKAYEIAKKELTPSGTSGTNSSSSNNNAPNISCMCFVLSESKFQDTLRRAKLKILCMCRQWCI